MLGSWLTACATTPPSSFFALNPVPLADAASERSGQPPSITIGPIDLPRYLDRPQIVTRDGANRLVVDEFNRWGGTLEEEIHRVVSDRLGARLGTQRIYRYPSRIVAETDYRVAIEFGSFDGVVGGAVQLDATWSLLDDATAQVREAGRVRYRDDNVGTDYADYAAALSGLLARLADDIASAVQRTNKNPPRGDG
jgi:uncharacterized lipoprotein YmbA